MARTQVNPDTGIAPVATIDLSVGADEVVYDLFVGNQGEGTMEVTIAFTEADFGRLFMPPHSHRPAVLLSSGDSFTLDSLENIQLVAERPGGGAATTTFSATARKTRVSPATSANDYLVVGVGSRN